MSNVLFVAGTGKDVGKTSVSISLIHSFAKQYKRIGYIKPISQRYVQLSEYKVGEDAFLIKQIFDFKYDINDMSPIIIDGNFTEKFIKGGGRTSFQKTILQAYNKIKKDSDFVIIEGSGHAGIGSVIGESNADIAKLLDADVLLVGGGGIGRAIDKMMLDKEFFESKGCNVIGVLINKVFPEKYEKVYLLLKRWFEKRRIPLFGILPYDAVLSRPNLALVKKETKATIVNGVEYLNKKFEKIIIATKTTEKILEDLQKLSSETLIVTSSDRIDLFLLLTSSCFLEHPASKYLSGILIAGDQRVSLKINEIFKSYKISVLISQSEIYDLSYKLFALKPKMILSDKDNIKTLQELSGEYIDVKALHKGLNEEKPFQKDTIINRIKLRLAEGLKKIRIKMSNRSKLK